MNFVMGAEVFSSLFLIIILYAVHFEMRNKSAHSTWFAICAWMALGANISDTLMYLLEGNAGIPEGIFLGIIFLNYVLGFFAEASYCCYLGSFLRYKGIAQSSIPEKIGLAAAVIMSIVFGAMVLMGGGFVVVDGIYHRSWGYLLTQIVPMLGMIGITVYAAHYRTKMPAHDTIALISYIIFPCLGVIGSIIAGQNSMVYPCSAVSILLVYVMLQKDTERDMEKINNTLYTESFRDSMTGLLNRRAYDQRCDHMEKNVWVGVMFLDLNALKYANDNYGHKAGDKLIIMLAELLKNNFRGDVIYRISGDEFVIIIENIQKKSFEERVERLHESIQAMEMPIAAMGSVHGQGEQIRGLLEQAEINMYKDKKAFYEKYPRYARKEAI